MLQVQGQLLVTERKWCDLICYCGGLPMKRCASSLTPNSERDPRRRGEIRGAHQRGRRDLARRAGERPAADPDRTND
jgi:hypothetical protein